MRRELSAAAAMAVAFLFIASPALSQDASWDAVGGLDDESVLFFEVPSVYGASKYEQKTTQAPSAVKIVTAEEIEAYGYQTLDEILASIAGLFSSDDRNYTYLGMRGFSEPGDYNSRVLVLLNGVRVNDATYDAASMGTDAVVDVEMIDRLEFIPGPSSSLYGASAFFGVVNIITKQGRDYRGGEVAGARGSLGHHRERATYGRKLPSGLEFLISGTYSNADGHERLYFEEFDDPTTNNGFADGLDGERFKNLFATVSRDNLSLQIAWNDRRKEVPTASYETVFNAPGTFTIDRTLQVASKYEHVFTDALSFLGNVEYGWYEYKADYIYDWAEAGEDAYLVINKDFVASSWWSTDLQLRSAVSDDHTVILGAAYTDKSRMDQWNYDLDGEDRYEYLDERRSDGVWALYAQDEYAILPSLRLNVGVRHDQYESFGGTTNPRAALIYSPGSRTTLKALYGTAFRAPSAYESYYHDSFWQKQAESLGPETIRTEELVIEQRMGAHIFGIASVYRYKVDDLVTLTVDPVDDLAIFTNSGTIDAYGGEVTLEGRWSNGWSARLSHALQRAEDGTTAERLTNSPTALTRLGLIAPVVTDAVRVGLDVRHMTARRTVKAAPVDGHVVAGLTLTARHPRTGLKVSAGVANIFDEKYRDPGIEEHTQVGIEQDGRTFRIEAAYGF